MKFLESYYLKLLNFIIKIIKNICGNYDQGDEKNLLSLYFSLTKITIIYSPCIEKGETMWVIPGKCGYFCILNLYILVSIFNLRHRYKC